MRSIDIVFTRTNMPQDGFPDMAVYEIFIRKGWSEEETYCKMVEELGYEFMDETTLAETGYEYDYYFRFVNDKAE